MVSSDRSPWLRVGMALVCAFTLVSSEASGTATPPPSVGELGTVTGAVSLAPGVGVYKAIPYAKPPVGARRWQPPAKFGAFGDLDGTKFGSVCAQHRGFTNTGSEDCLFLNVGAPLSSTAAVEGGADPLLPVLVWIHGGSYVSGASNLYDPATLVATSNNSVVACLN